jgi:hypothetical protein
MIQGYVHHITLSCGCRILVVQASDGSFSRRDARHDCSGDKSHVMLPSFVDTPPASSPAKWVFERCPIPACCQPGGPWTEAGPPVRVISDSVHAVHDTDRVPDGVYIGDLCCCSRTCPHGYWARIGQAQIKMEQLSMFE